MQRLVEVGARSAGSQSLVLLLLLLLLLLGRERRLGGFGSPPERLLKGLGVIFARVRQPKVPEEGKRRRLRRPDDRRRRATSAGARPGACPCCACTCTRCCSCGEEDVVGGPPLPRQCRALV
jgi:hypothetical protein